jgi:hypothetical protein
MLHDFPRRPIGVNKAESPMGVIPDDPKMMRLPLKAHQKDVTRLRLAVDSLTHGQQDSAL